MFCRSFLFSLLWTAQAFARLLSAASLPSFLSFFSVFFLFCSRSSSIASWTPHPQKIDPFHCSFARPYSRDATVLHSFSRAVRWWIPHSAAAAAAIFVLVGSHPLRADSWAYSSSRHTLGSQWLIITNCGSRWSCKLRCFAQRGWTGQMEWRGRRSHNGTTCRWWRRKNTFIYNQPSNKKEK